MRKYMTVFAVFILFALCSCRFDTDKPLIYMGFKIAPLPEKWYVDPSEQYSDLALIRRDSDSSTFTIFVKVQLRNDETLHFLDELEASVRENAFVIQDTSRYELVRTSVTRDTQFGVQGIAYMSEVQDKKAPNVNGNTLTMLTTYFSCLHPHLANEIFTMCYSERGLPSEVNSKYIDEVKNIINSITLTADN